MIDPGAGLLHLDSLLQDPEDLFDSVFSEPPQSHLMATGGIAQDSHSQPAQDVVRGYSSGPDLLAAYYAWLHPYFPILPPAISQESVDCPLAWPTSSFEPPAFCLFSESPLVYVILALMAMIPHPNVVEHSNPTQVARRREAAHQLAKQALEGIERDSELPDSTVSPAQALSAGKRYLNREPLHPAVPVELESTIALCLLTIYEYAQRGNVKKMKDRASQALSSAVELGLHLSRQGADPFAEAKCRTWWMTYICACQSSIVGCTVCCLTFRRRYHKYLMSSGTYLFTS
jgi:hypothetical protein